MKKGYPILTVILIFIFSFAIRYYPIYHKGYSCCFSPLELILARNLSLTGEYNKMSDKNNIVLSSSLVSEKGVPSIYGNKLTPILYGKLFNILGPEQEIPLYFNLLIYSLTTILLFLLVLKLFNFRVALIFAGIDIFIPFIAAGAVWFGAYEWAILFFSLGLFVYLYQEKIGWLGLILSSLLFGLAALSRNAFLISFIPFIVYEWWKNKSFKRIIIFILPFILVWGGMMIYDSQHGMVNRYLSKGDIGYDGHLFPDPYTYRFEKEEFIENIEGSSDSQISEFLIKYGYGVNLKNRLLMYLDSAKFYIIDVFRLISFGGALILLFAGAGIVYLWKRKKHLMVLFGLWFILWYLLLICLKTNNSDHFLEIRFPIILLISLGIFWLAEHVWKSSLGITFKYILLVCVFLSLVLHFNQADKWLFHDLYSNGKTEIFLSFAENVKNANLTKEDVVAMGPVGGGAPELTMNYYTDSNFVYFDPNTIKNLLKENKLQWAFDQFGITKILGYDQKLSEEIIKTAKVQNIASLPCQ